MASVKGMCESNDAKSTLDKGIEYMMMIQVNIGRQQSTKFGGDLDDALLSIKYK